MSKITRCDVLVDEPEPVLQWLAVNVGPHVVRKMAYETVFGWHVKIALEGTSAVARFRERWADDKADAQAKRRRAERLNEIRRRTGPQNGLPDAGTS